MRAGVGRRRGRCVPRERSPIRHGSGRRMAGEQSPRVGSSTGRRRTGRRVGMGAALVESPTGPPKGVADGSAQGSRRRVRPGERSPRRVGSSTGQRESSRRASAGSGARPWLMGASTWRRKGEGWRPSLVGVHRRAVPPARARWVLGLHTKEPSPGPGCMVHDEPMPRVVRRGGGRWRGSSSLRRQVLPLSLLGWPPPSSRRNPSRRSPRPSHCPAGGVCPPARPAAAGSIPANSAAASVHRLRPAAAS